MNTMHFKTEHNVMNTTKIATELSQGQLMPVTSILAYLLGNLQTNHISAFGSKQRYCANSHNNSHF